MQSAILVIATMMIMVLAGVASAQSFQPNTATHALQFDAPALTAVGQPVPILRRIFSGDAVSIHLQGGTDTAGNAAQPFALLYSPSNTMGATTSIQVFFAGGIRLDIVDVGAPGYFDQFVINGFDDPAFGTMDSLGRFNFSASLPSCAQDPSASLCTTAPFTEVSLQAVVVDMTQLPLGLNSTGAGTLQVVDGFQEFTFSSSPNDQFGVVNFQDGFTFDFYGTSYASAFVSENGYIQFSSGAALSSFPSPTVSSILSAPPRIMCFFDDLVYGSAGGFTPRIFSEHFSDGNTRKIRFVFENLQEFGNATGPHGGEITLAESGEISIFVAGYNAFPSINTAVGLSPGAGFPQSATTGFDPTFGRDLSSAIGSSQALGAHVAAFELFDHINPPGPLNPLDLIGLDTSNPVGPGFSFQPNPALSPPSSGYIID